MPKLVQFTDVHFPDLNSNSYDNLNNMKLDLNLSTRSVNLSANNQGIYVYKWGWLQVSSKYFALYVLKGTHLVIGRNGIFSLWARLFIFLDIYVPTYCDCFHIFKILPIVRSTINGRKANADP